MRRVKSKPASNRAAGDRTESHPIERFRPGNSIQSGSALKDLFDSTYVELLSESLAQHWPDFDAHEFRQRAGAELEHLELKRGLSRLLQPCRLSYPTTLSRPSHC